MNEVNEKEVYIPEYNPQKYKKEYKVTRIISIILFVLMIIGVALFLAKVFLDKNSFMVNVNGVLEKDWSWIIIQLSMIVAPLGIASLVLFVLYKRLKQANAVFSETDEQKRLEGHLKFDKQAKTAAKIHATIAAAQVAQHTKKD